MIDARETFRKVNTTINDFSPEQLDGLKTLIKALEKKGKVTNNKWLSNNFEKQKYEDKKVYAK